MKLDHDKNKKEKTDDPQYLADVPSPETTLVFLQFRVDLLGAENSISD